MTMIRLESGISLSIEQQGQGSNTIVLVHGLASSKNIWDFVFPILIKQTKVVRFDQRGHGLSSKPEQGYSWDLVSKDLEALFEALLLKNIILVGHSWGADVALHYTAHFPQLVKGLCLVDGGLIDFQKHLSWSEAENLLAPPDNLGISKETLLEQFPKWLGPAWRPDAASILFSLFQEQADGTFKPRLGKKQHMEIVRALWEQRPFDLYPQINCPTTVLTAIPPLPHDDYTRQLVSYRQEGLRHAKRHIKQLKTVTLENTIHDIPIHRPERLAEEISQLLP